MSLQRDLDRIRENANQILIAVEKIGNSDKLGQNVNAFGFSTRVLTCLARREIKYLDDLLELSKKDLLKIRGMGASTFNEIKSKVNALGFDMWN